MSRGPGSIERAISQAFETEPSRTFTVEELTLIAYPGINRPEKKHRVAVLRAADKVGSRSGWIGRRAERPGGTIIYSNLYDHRSYALGRIRRNIVANWRDAEYPERAIDDPKVCPSDYESAQPGGVWWLHVEINKAVRDGHHEDEKIHRAALDGAITAALRRIGR
jgi:hypothetical protein